MCTQPKGPMGKCKALETALNNKLLSSHEHLKKGVFSPLPLCTYNTHVTSPEVSFDLTVISFDKFAEIQFGWKCCC